MEKEFIKAIHDMKKIRVTFFSQKDETLVARICAPMDFGPSSRSSDQEDRFHVWDYEGSGKPHTASLKPDQVEKIEMLEEEFDPVEFVKWNPNWIVSRDWGQYS